MFNSQFVEFRPGKKTYQLFKYWLTDQMLIFIHHILICGKTKV